MEFNPILFVKKVVFIINLASKLLNRGIQITDYHLSPFDDLQSRAKANAQRGEQHGNYEQ